MLRIKDPVVTVPFYENNFGMKLIHKYDFPQWNFGLYFLGIPPEGTQLPEAGTKASEEYLWNIDYPVLEFTHNYGTEKDDSFKVNNGNVEPHRGFGHIAMMTHDVNAACDKLEAAGARFQKKPVGHCYISFLLTLLMIYHTQNEGRMKGLAFVLDPDG